jgi:putative membrane protein
MRTSSIVKNSLIAGAVAAGVAGLVRANERRRFPGDGLSTRDIALMNRFVQANLAEIACAELAVDRSQNDHIVKFAKSMIGDHSKALNQFSRLAKAKNVNLSVAADENHRAALEKLRALDDDQFDRKYVLQAGISDHQDTLALVNEIMQTADDKELIALAEKLAPTIDHHLKMAESMKGFVSH